MDTTQLETLTIVRGDELPPQIHHGTRPSHWLLKPVRRDRFARYAAWPTSGFWTSSLDAETGTTAFHIHHGAHDCDPGVADWQVTPRADARILTIATLADYDALLASTLNNNPALPLCEQVGGRFFPTWRIKWDKVVGICDAVRILPAVTAAIRQRSRSALPWWAHESTLWLDWCFAEVTPRPGLSWGMGAAEANVEPEEQAAARYGIPLPDDVYPLLDDGTLAIPIDDPLDDVGLVVALSRVVLRATAMTNLWPETTDAAARCTLWTDHRYTGIVLVEQRRAVGLAITVETSTWGEGDVTDTRIVLQNQDIPLPSLHLLFVCTDTPAGWYPRAAKLVSAAAQANRVAPHELVFRGPFDARLWDFFKSYAKDGWIYLTA